MSDSHKAKIRSFDDWKAQNPSTTINLRRLWNNAQEAYAQHVREAIEKEIDLLYADNKIKDERMDSCNRKKIALCKRILSRLEL